jgi:metal-responsive CopG/Arc/MetJ family transcriptional regulator
MPPTKHDTELVAARVSRRLADEIDTIAKRDEESRSTIVRRLLRRALESERAHAGEAA